MSVRWGLSPLERRSHAIDEGREHPSGMFRTECGRLLMMVTTLREAPCGPPCEACAALQLAAVQGLAPPAEFGTAWRRAGPGDPADLTLPR